MTKTFCTVASRSSPARKLFTRSQHQQSNRCGFYPPATASIDENDSGPTAEICTQAATFCSRKRMSVPVAAASAAESSGEERKHDDDGDDVCECMNVPVIVSAACLPPTASSSPRLPASPSNSAALVLRPSCSVIVRHVLLSGRAS